MSVICSLSHPTIFCHPNAERKKSDHTPGQPEEDPASCYPRQLQQHPRPSSCSSLDRERGATPGPLRGLFSLSLQLCPLPLNCHFPSGGSPCPAPVPTVRCLHAPHNVTFIHSLPHPSVLILSPSLLYFPPCHHPSTIPSTPCHHKITDTP